MKQLTERCICSDAMERTIQDGKPFEEAAADIVCDILLEMDRLLYKMAPEKEEKYKSNMKKLLEAYLKESEKH